MCAYVSVFASILVHVCASVCSPPFLFKCVQECVRFHSCSSVCKCVFASILVHVCASACSLPFFSSMFKSVFASILVLVCEYMSVCSLPFLFKCVHVCVRFHSYSCECMCVFASILVLL